MLLPLSICFAAFFNHPAFGDDNDVQVEADLVSHNLETSQVEFKGNVIVTRDDVRLEADLLKYSKTDEGVEIALASGSPVFAETGYVEGEPQLRIFSNQVTLYRDSDKIEFDGEVKIERDDIVVNAPRATYYSDTRSFETISISAESQSGKKSRTTATIFQD